MSKEKITLGVIVERIEGIKTHINTKFEANKKEHEALDKNQKTTNGEVKKLQLWKAGIVGAFGIVAMIIVPISIYILDEWRNDAISNTKYEDRLTAMEDTLNGAEIEFID